MELLINLFYNLWPYNYKKRQKWKSSLNSPSVNKSEALNSFTLEEPRGHAIKYERKKKREREESVGGATALSHPLLQLNSIWNGRLIMLLASEFWLPCAGREGNGPLWNPSPQTQRKGAVSEVMTVCVYASERGWRRERLRERELAHSPLMIPMATELFLPSLSKAPECRATGRGKRGQHAHNEAYYKKHALKTCTLTI